MNRISLCVETGIAGEIEPDTVADEILSVFFKDHFQQTNVLLLVVIFP